MKKNFKWMLSLLVAVFAVSMIGNTAFAESFDNIEDGEYEIDVESLKVDSDETSAAGQFISNEADISIQEGTGKLKVKVKKGDMDGMEYEIKSMVLEGKDPVATEEDDDAKYFTFEVDSLQENYKAGMNYVVPSLDMDHDVEFRLKLNLDEFPVKESGEEPENPENPEDSTEGEGTVEDDGEQDNGTSTTEDNNIAEDNEDDSSGVVGDNGDNGSATTNGEEVTNPQTGDTTNIWFYTLLLIGSIMVPAALLFKRRFAHK